MTPREIRLTVGESQARTAVKAGVSEPTLRLYEANRDAVTPQKRRALDAVYADMEASLPASAA